jgi:thiamine biosynthesis lipoprotein
MGQAEFLKRAAGVFSMDRNNRRLAVGIAGAAILASVFYFSVIRDRASAPAERVSVDSGMRQVMGTFARIVAVAADERVAKECIETGLAEFVRVDNSMSDYKAESELSLVNNRADKKVVEVSEELFEVLEKSIEFSQKTGGAFDITVGPLVDLYHRAEEEGIKPGEEEISLAKSKVGFEKLKLDKQKRTVRFAASGMRLDLGGIAKGHAIDKAIKAIRKRGGMGAMADIGGDIRCFGVAPPGRERWVIGLQEPEEQAGGSIESRLSLILELTDVAVATSGDYRRFVVIEGEKFSHIIDTESGAGSNKLRSVTIIAKSALEADALATAVSVMGTEAGLELIEGMPATEAILIPSATKKGLIKTSGADTYIK